MRHNFIILFGFSLLLQVGQANAASRNDTSSLACIEVASRQLDEALALMQKHYYKKKEVQWDTL
ncbi:MAG TPA: hypothetical protein VEZ17_13210, partial [Chitinophagaceae bacterium]|nr:hypothetical protein [Chitinophagaceae bacterium]